MGVSLRARKEGKRESKRVGGGEKEHGIEKDETNKLRNNSQRQTRRHTPADLPKRIVCIPNVPNQCMVHTTLYIWLAQRCWYRVTCANADESIVPRDDTQRFCDTFLFTCNMGYTGRHSEEGAWKRSLSPLVSQRLPILCRRHAALKHSTKHQSHFCSHRLKDQTNKGVIGEVGWLGEIGEDEKVQHTSCRAVRRIDRDTTITHTVEVNTARELMPVTTEIRVFGVQINVDFVQNDGRRRASRRVQGFWHVAEPERLWCMRSCLVLPVQLHVHTPYMCVDATLPAMSNSSSIAAGGHTDN